MKIWPRSLRMRLILVLTVAMVATQALVFVAVAEFFGREQRTDRAMQMARMVAFVKSRVEATPDIPLDQPLSPRSLRRRPMMSDGTSRDERNALPPTGRPTPGEVGSADGNRPRSPRDMGDQKGDPKSEARLRPADTPALRLPPSRDMSTVTVTASPPAGDGEADLVAAMRTVVPEVVSASYREANDFFRLGPYRPYIFEVWAQLAANPQSGQTRYLKMVLDETRQAGEHPVGGGTFATLDLVLRVAVGVGLALIIMGWISKPLSRLAESADATLPNGEIRPGAVRFDASEAPTEIAHTLAAFDRMRGRIGAMVSERTTMLTALAHDLRTPITRLMLRLELSNDEKLRNDAYRDCEQMQQLISRTLDFIRSSEKGANVGLLKLDGVITQVMATLPADERSRCVLDLRAGSIMVYANGWGLERAIANVLDNALKYSPPSSQVDVSVAAVDGRVSITVADLGPGVPEDMLSRLREPFFRVDAARNLDDGGAGLGLSIVDNLVKLYGGDVVIKNRGKGGGLEVTIWLATAALS